MKVLLKKAIEKQIELSKEEFWDKEFLEKAPPIVWFGNLNSKKENILTLGANPSREEFLLDNKEKAKIKVCCGDKPTYLPKKRLYHLTEYQNYTSILNDDITLGLIIESYNNYFENNPYKWFGKKETRSDKSYNVEGFLNSINSSYYKSEYKYQSLHIDLFPFATISDFKEINPQAEKDLFDNNWAQIFLEELISKISPRYIVIFGKTNLMYFKELFKIDIGREELFSHKKSNNTLCSAKYWFFEYQNMNYIGISANLGNPKGFNKESLSSLGQSIMSSVIKQK